MPVCHARQVLRARTVERKAIGRTLPFADVPVTAARGQRFRVDIDIQIRLQREARLVGQARMRGSANARC